MFRNAHFCNFFLLLFVYLLLLLFFLYCFEDFVLKRQNEHVCISNRVRKLSTEKVREREREKRDLGEQRVRDLPEGG